MSEVVKSEQKPAGKVQDVARAYDYEKGSEPVVNYTREEFIAALKEKKLSNQEIINYMHMRSAMTVVEYYRSAGMEAPVDILLIALMEDVNNVSDSEVITLQKAYGEEAIGQIYISQGQDLPAKLSFGQSFLGFFGRLFNAYDKVNKNTADMNSLRRSSAMRNDIAKISNLYTSLKNGNSSSNDKISGTVNSENAVETVNMSAFSKKLNVTFVKEDTVEEADLNLLQDTIVKKVKDKIEGKNEIDKLSDNVDELSKSDDPDKAANVAEELTEEEKTNGQVDIDKNLMSDVDSSGTKMFAQYGSFIILKEPKIKNFSGIRKNINLITSQDILINIKNFGKYTMKDVNFQVMYDAKNDSRVATMKGGNVELVIGDFKFSLKNIRFNSADEAFCPQTTQLTYNAEIDENNTMAVSGSVGDLRISRGDISFKSFAVGINEFSFLDGMFTGSDVKFFMGRKNKEDSNIQNYAKGLAIGSLAFTYKDDEKNIVKINFNSDESGKSDITGVQQILEDNDITASYLFCKDDTGRFGLELNKAKFDLSIYDDLVQGSIEEVDLKNTPNGKSFRAGKATASVNLDFDSIKTTLSTKITNLTVSSAGTDFDELSVGIGMIDLFDKTVQATDANFVLNGKLKNYSKGIYLGSFGINAGENFEFSLGSNNSENESEKGHWALVQNITQTKAGQTSSWEPDIKDATASIKMFKVINVDAERINYKDKILQIGKAAAGVKIESPLIDGGGEIIDMSYDFAKKEFNFTEFKLGVNDINLFDGTVVGKKAYFTVTKANNKYTKNIGIDTLELGKGNDFKALIGTADGKAGWNIGQNENNEWYTYVEGGTVTINTEYFDLISSNINVNNAEKAPGLNALRIDDITGKLKVLEDQTGGVALTVKGLELKNKSMDFESITAGMAKLDVFNGFKLTNPNFTIKKAAEVNDKGQNGTTSPYSVCISSGFSGKLGEWGTVSSTNVSLTMSGKSFESFKVANPSLKLSFMNSEIKADSLDVLNTASEKGIKVTNLDIGISKKPENAESSDKESNSFLDYLGLDGLSAKIDNISYINNKFMIGKPKFSVDEISIGKETDLTSLKIGLGEQKYIKGSLNFQFPGGDSKPAQSSGMDLTSEPQNNSSKDSNSKLTYPQGIDPTAFGARDYTPPEVFGMNFTYPLIPGLLGVHAGFGFGAGINVYGLLSAAINNANESTSAGTDNSGTKKYDLSGTLGFAGGLWAAAKIGAEAGLTNILTINADFLAKLGLNVKAGAKADATVVREKNQNSFRTSVSKAEINFGITADLILALIGKISTKVLFFKEKTLYEKKFKEWQLGALGFAGKATYESGRSLIMEDIKKGMTINGKEIGSIKSKDDLNALELEDVNKKIVDIKGDRQNAEKLLLDLENYADVPGIGEERKELAELVNEVIVIYENALQGALTLAKELNKKRDKAQDKVTKAENDHDTNTQIQRRKMRLEYLYSERNTIVENEKKIKRNDKEKYENTYSDYVLESFRNADYATQDYMKAAFVVSFYGYTRFLAQNNSTLRANQTARARLYKEHVKDGVIPYNPEVFFYDITTMSEGASGYRTFKIADKIEKYLDPGTYTLSSNFYDIIYDTDTLSQVMDFGKAWVLPLIYAGGSGFSLGGDNNFYDRCNDLVKEYLTKDDYSLRFKLLRDDVDPDLLSDKYVFGSDSKKKKKSKSANLLKSTRRYSRDEMKLKGLARLDNLIKYEEDKLFGFESNRRGATEFYNSIDKQVNSLQSEIKEIESILNPLKVATTKNEKDLDQGSKNKQILAAVKEGCQHIRENKLTQEKAKSLRKNPALFLLSRSKE